MHERLHSPISRKFAHRCVFFFLSFSFSFFFLFSFVYPSFLNFLIFFLKFPFIPTSMNREPDHVMAYCLSELGTTGNLDGNEALIIRGRFQQKNVTAILRRYISCAFLFFFSFFSSCPLCSHLVLFFFWSDEYVVCHMCRSLETKLTKVCMACLWLNLCSRNHF